EWGIKEPHCENLSAHGVELGCSASISTDGVLTLLKHDMALDYILAKQGGLCVALNLTGDACYTLIPDNTDNMTNVIEALKHIREAFGPSKGAGIMVCKTVHVKMIMYFF
uniref:Uncharacterized protein n=1 Tax=Astyanax mexicanus TaxID=7994 RepID=A0A3B1JQR6_ASTMX